ncbi:MAG TPA: hypothetical protein PLT23_11315 [Lentisphaeria bacterium]|nr:hypothetical protein [Lentisphaerota bacterium]HPY91309.1 hypothetical protein [Lentisphaeria bacterium]HQL88513.1 hypothetical protein [Lentisphaeria bacterium]
MPATCEQALPNQCRPELAANSRQLPLSGRWLARKKFRLSQSRQFGFVLSHAHENQAGHGKKQAESSQDDSSPQALSGEAIPQLPEVFGVAQSLLFCLCAGESDGGDGRRLMFGVQAAGDQHFYDFEAEHEISPWQVLLGSGFGVALVPFAGVEIIEVIKKTRLFCCGYLKFATD